MKKILLLALALCLLFTCIGCGNEQESNYKFYYVRTPETIAYGQADALIAPVPQEIASPDAELNYLIQLYLNGPQDSHFQNPIPKGTYLLSTILREDMLVLVLSREFSTLEGIQLTLAGACLTATCHELTGRAKIQVISGGESYDFDLTSYTFLDDSTGE